MQIAFDTKNAAAIDEALKATCADIASIAYSFRIENISGAVSLHPGISQWGASQSAILGSGYGAAQKVIKTLSGQAEWLNAAFRASVAALSGQNRFIARGIELVDLGGEVGHESVSFPDRPVMHVENFSFPKPFHSPRMTLAALVTELTSTNYGQIVAASSEWKLMSGRAAKAAEELTAIAAQIEAETSGDVFNRASSRIAEVGSKLLNFSERALTISTSLDQDMVKIKAMQQEALAAQSQVMLIQEPASRIAAEEAAVSALNASFAAKIPTLGPPINNLVTSVLGGATGGGALETGMDALPGNDGTKARKLQQMAVVGAQGTHSALAGGGSPEQVVAQAKNIGTNAANFQGVASNAGLGQLQTTQASSGIGVPGYGGAMAGGVPGGGANGIGLQGSGMTGNRKGGLAGAMGVTGPSSRGIGGVGLGTSASKGFSGAMPHAGLAGGQHVTGLKTNGFGRGEATLNGGGRGVGGVGGGGGVGSRLTGGVGAGGPVGDIGSGGIGQTGTRGSAPQPMASPMAGAGVGKGATAVGAANAAGGRPVGMLGGAPMGAAAGAANSKTGKVQHVTSVVEQDANVKALLGEPTPVVPGVIGDWVRG